MKGFGTMELIPAIDLRDGRCVRLLKGDFTAETVYSDDPQSVLDGDIDGFLEAGIRWRKQQEQQEEQEKAAAGAK